MNEPDNFRNLLESFRVLDLTNETGFFTGKILADLGADVIKIENPGGDSARNIGPFYHNIPDGEKSLYWFAYNINKRGITLNIETSDGRHIFGQLVKKADIVIESFSVGYMDKLGLGYSALSKINPRLVMTSITPFGQTGPYRHYKSSDIVATAMGGLLYLTGHPDHPPVRISFPQACLRAGAYAAAATMIACYYRETTGEGQYVDVSIQACIALGLANAIPLWELDNVILPRAGPFLVSRGMQVRARTLWQCKDGYIMFQVMGGRTFGKSNRKIIEWMENEEMTTGLPADTNWAFDMSKQTQENQDQMERAFAEFFMRHTKAELYDKALKSGVMLCPLSSVKDITEDTQLQARDYWIQVEHPELGIAISYPGAFFKASEIPCSTARRAPLIGEHNEEIYHGELGLSIDEMCVLKQAAVI